MATVIVEKETVAGQDDVDSIDVGSLRVFAGLCCSTCSLYTAWPNCCGGVFDGEVLCIQGKSTCCKPYRYIRRMYYKEKFSLTHVLYIF